MDKTIDFPKKDELVRTLRENHVVFAALFGSRAKGTARPDSDYDILVEFNPSFPVPYSKFFHAKEMTKKVLDSDIDFLTMKSVSKFMRNEVISTMRVIYDDRTGKR